MKRTQMSESLITIFFITLSGGFQDAYTYFARGKVFANAQTGNIVLMSSHFFEGEWMSGIKYLIPLFFFAIGVFLTEQIEGKYKHAKNFHWRQWVLMIEIVLLFVSGLLNEEWNLLVNAMISFACAMQVQAFRKYNQNAYASTMCIGNLRSAMANLSTYTRKKEPQFLHNSLYYFTVIFIFFLGAGLGSIAVDYLHFHAIWFSCIALLIAYLLMMNQKKWIT